MYIHMTVFFDPIGKRKKYFKLFTIFLVLFILSVFSILAIEIIRQESFPRLTFNYSEKGDTYIVNEDGINHISYVDSKYLALTFDDGPDKRNTPKILDILKDSDTKATFFVVGNNINLYPDLLNDIYNQGHEIGNHTYTHANVEKISNFQLNIETESTQEILESRLGFKTRLFRAPYSDDRDPEVLSQIEPLKITSGNGMVNVGMKIDPKDWQADSSAEIVDKVLAYIAEEKGNVILLHDGGEDRTKTIEALPVLIESLKNKGYTFVTVSQLIGMDDPYVYQHQSISSVMANKINLLAFNILRYFGLLIKGIAIVSLFIGIIRFILVTVFALIDKKRKKLYSGNSYPKVAAIVPAFNEDKVVAKTVDSLLSSDYPNLEIVVVDDGSSDRTHHVIKEYFGDNPKVKNFRKENGGKSSAINYGLKQTDSEIVVILDADTIIKKDAIRKLAVYFGDENIGAVAGNAKVGNRNNFLTKMQAIEYITSQNLERRAFNVFNSIRVVAGAIGAWRREVLIKAGGFTHDTLAEDTDMTLKILRLGYRIEYEPSAIAYTEAPETIESFMKQRFRWMHGTLQAIWKHTDTLLKPSFGAMGFIAIPDVLLFQVFFPLFAPLMDLFLVSNIFISLLNMWMHPTTYSTLALKQALIYYVAFMLFDYVSSGISFIMEKKENKKLLFYLLLQRFVYRQLLYISAIKSTLTAINGESVGWGKLERTSNVPHKFRVQYAKVRA
jgi:peptidoglycan-N-acetylglucosamine deacetylase